MRSTSARWLASKAVMPPGRMGPGLAAGTATLGSGWPTGASDNGGEGFAAAEGGGPAVPVFGCGAGFGTGIGAGGTGAGCAIAPPVRLAATMHAIAARLAVRIIPSALPRRLALAVAARYGDFATCSGARSRIGARAVLNSVRSLPRQPGSRVCRHDWRRRRCLL